MTQLLKTMHSKDIPTEEGGEVWPEQGSLGSEGPRDCGHRGGQPGAEQTQ